ncbi:Hypothetical protein D9617_45g091400 [Elsinoe fawcettii]|nr:Hypothetical protein D9617_45g091400 [Elsinoe fawcettii]
MSDYNPVANTKRLALGGRGPAILTGGWILCGLGIMLVSLRLWATSRKAGRLRWDFLWVAFAIVWCIASHACFTVALYHGIGSHVRFLTYAEVFHALHWVWISLFVGIIGGIFSKFAIIALLLEVQSPHARGRRLLLWTLGVVLAATGVCQICLSLFKCEPVPKLWNPTLPGTCPRATAAAKFSYFQGAVNASADIFLSLFPITIVWNLQASMRTKIGFCLLMAFGAIPSIAVIIRTTLLKKLAASQDITWDFGPFMIWASTELWSVIIIGCIPPLRPLFLRLFVKEINSMGRSGGTRGSTHETSVGICIDVIVPKTGVTNAHPKSESMANYPHDGADEGIRGYGSTDNVLAGDHLRGESYRNGR